MRDEGGLNVTYLWDVTTTREQTTWSTSLTADYTDKVADVPITKDWLLLEKVMKKTPLDLQKRFPIYHACPKYLAAHRCGSAFSENGLAFRQDFEKMGKTQVDW